MVEAKERKSADNRADLTGLFLLASGVLIFLWLYWEPSQGIVGKYVVSALFYLFGWVSAVFAVALALAGILIIARAVIPDLVKKLAGIFIIVCAVSAFLDLSKKVQAILPAGAAGNIFAATFKGLFGNTGAYIIDGVILIMGLLFTFETSVKKILRFLAIHFVKLFNALLALTKFLKKRRIPAGEKVKKMPPKPQTEDEIRKNEAEQSADVRREQISPDPKIPQTRPSGVKEYQLPPEDILIKSPRGEKENYDSQSLEKALDSFGIKAKVSEVIIGPCVIRYELSMEAGQKISQVQSLTNDIALQLMAESIRVLAPIPGKAAVGIEVPRKNRAVINLRELLTSDAYVLSPAKLPIALGKNVIGDAIVADLGTMPHLLIGGATGSGKSVVIHNIILSLLYKFAPWDLKLLLIDAKMVELTVYNDIPHLLSRVETNVSGAVASLKWVVFEMERRLKIFSQVGVRDIAGFHETGEMLPYIIVIIDELADLMNVAQRDMELAITRLSQMSRACGIHLILSTQRPSVNVITGVIKANLPARLSLQVISKIDSRTILDSQGGEALLGNGDMLYLQPGSSSLERIQAPFVSRHEVQKIVRFIINQNIEFEYLDLAREVKQRNLSASKITDDIFWDAAEFLISQGKASTSLLQRRFHIGYGRSAALIDTMYELGIIGEDLGPTKGREILLDEESLEKLKAEM